GQHHDRDAAQVLVLFDLGEYLAPVDPGQVEVEQHEVGARRVGVLALPPQVGQGLLAVAHDVERVADLVLLERLLGHEDVARVVLDQQLLDRQGGLDRGGHAAISSATASAGTSSGAGTGNVNRKSVPSRCSRSIQTRPPWYSTIFF